MALQIFLKRIKKQAFQLYGYESVDAIFFKNYYMFTFLLLLFSFEACREKIYYLNWNFLRFIFIEPLQAALF